MREHYYDPITAERWADRNGRYAAPVTRAQDFAQRTRQRLSELLSPHARYFPLDDPAYPAQLVLSGLDVPPQAMTYESVGASIVTLPDGYFVEEVFPGGPAEAGGLLRGDRLLTVDKKTFLPGSAWTGQSGQRLTITFQREKNGPTLQTTVVPRSIDIKVEWREILRRSARVQEIQGHRVGYLRIFACPGDEYRLALQYGLLGPLENAESLILDLRDGMGNCSLDLLNLFNALQPSFVQTSRDGMQHELVPSWQKPLIILVNQGTRGGKEVLAWTLQKRKLGRLVGEKTAGEVMQTRLFMLSDGSLLQLPVADIAVEGLRLESQGVTPDVIQTAPLRFSAGQDPVMEAALKALTATSP